MRKLPLKPVWPFKVRNCHLCQESELFSTPLNHFKNPQAFCELHLPTKIIKNWKYKGKPTINYLRMQTYHLQLFSLGCRARQDLPPVCSLEHRLTGAEILFVFVSCVVQIMSPMFCKHSTAAEHQHQGEDCRNDMMNSKTSFLEHGCAWDFFGTIHTENLLWACWNENKVNKLLLAVSRLQFVAYVTLHKRARQLFVWCIVPNELCWVSQYVS